MYWLELIKFDVSNTSYYVEVENGALLRDVTRSWKMILGGHGKVVENFFRKKSVGTLLTRCMVTSRLSIAQPQR